MSLGRLKRTLKVTVAGALYYSGALTLWQRIVLRRKAVVLMYHRVLTPGERARTGSHPGIVVTQETFAKHMALLKRRFNVLSLEEFAHRLQHRLPFPDSSCLITFDDGWRDNLINGLPILREHGLPALVFLPVNFIGAKRLFWREALTHLLVAAVHDAREDPEGRARLQAALAPVRLGDALAITDVDPRPAVAEVVAARGELTEAAVEPVLASLSGELGLRIEDLETPDTFIDWRQAEQMAREGVTFGGHGANHRLLARLPADEMKAEVQHAKAAVDSRFASMVASFSYPNGSWNREVAECVRATGYRMAFTTVPGFVACDDDPFALRRQNVHESATDTTPMFVASILGLI